MPPNQEVTTHNFLVEDSAAGSRLDLYLTHKLQVSRSEVQELLKEGAVSVNKLTTSKSALRLKEGDSISLTLTSQREEPGLVPVPGNLDILYEDQSILVLNKAQDVVVHPAAGHRGNTLVHHLLHYFKHHSDFGIISDTRPGIVHRLDKGTSGVLLIAKNRKTQEALSDQFKNRMVDKEYECIVWGLIIREGLIKTPIGRDRTHRNKMSSRTSNPRASETKFIPIKTFKHFSHLRVKPKTGRTHQIRVHLSEFGHSIVGDPLYGKGLTPKREEQLDPIICSYLKETPFPYLHARGLSFLHPDTQTQVSFQAPLPQPFQELLKLLNENDEV